jgi:flagellar basal body rod protein FlgF
MSFNKKGGNAKGKRNYAQVGSFALSSREGENGEKSYYIKISKDTQLTINGKKVKGEYLNVEKPTVKFDRMLAKGTISQEEYNDKIAAFEGEGKLSFIKFEISAELE